MKGLKRTSMVCEKCGAGVKKGAQFCNKCGQKIVASVQQNEIKTLEYNETDKKTLFGKLVIAVGVVVLIIVLVSLFNNKHVVIDLNEYVTVDFSGYDSVGTASYTIDWKAMEEEYAELILKKVKSIEEPEVLMEYLRYSIVSGNLDKTNELNNGDSVLLRWNCKDEVLEEKYNVRLKYEDKVFKVDGLNDVCMVDPFENLNVIFSGISPIGDASLEGIADTYNNSIYFELSDRTGLSNGDVVTLYLGYHKPEETILSTSGVKFLETEKEYVVEGLDEYISSFGDISEDALDAMKQQAKDAYLAYAANEWVDGEKLEEMTYLGSYFLYAKNQEDAPCHNQVCLVYKVVASDNFPKTGVYNTFEYYVAIYFSDITKNVDGTVTVDLESYSCPTGSFSREVNTGNYRSWESSETLSYVGFVDIDTLFTKAVTAKVEEYMYESVFAEVVSE